MGAVDEQSFQLLYRLCGNEAADRVQLVTTMWDEVDESEAVEVEETLKGTHWQSFMQAGAQPRRFDNTSESAWNIVEPGHHDEDTSTSKRIGGHGENTLRYPCWKASRARQTGYSPRPGETVVWRLERAVGRKFADWKWFKFRRTRI
ncbi:hypothetical protein EDD17DRAFT_831328 [Pisolithus thermaeus]|nr:hypothetical protein EDD17DRAFT_831328 [Pisolithus thermaeus]